MGGSTALLTNLWEGCWEKLAEYWLYCQCGEPFNFRRFCLKKAYPQKYSLSCHFFHFSPSPSFLFIFSKFLFLLHLLNPLIQSSFSLLMTLPFLRYRTNLILRWLQGRLDIVSWRTGHRQKHRIKQIWSSLSTRRRWVERCCSDRERFIRRTRGVNFQFIKTIKGSRSLPNQSISQVIFKFRTKDLYSMSAYARNSSLSQHLITFFYHSPLNPTESSSPG